MVTSGSYTANFEMQSQSDRSTLASGPPRLAAYGAPVARDIAGFISGGFMIVRQPLSRRRFFGGVAATFGAMTLHNSELFAQAAGTQATATTQRFGGSDADYDRMIKLASNENNYGPPKSVMDAMNGAWKYANRYGYPDGNVIEAIA
ncbi:MAG TPA: hypothetical protein VEA16_02840, partial [Vicinamibacterales bacterium]|nr:hypothetical protein [Vicinamibacterales bacterium]